MAIEIKTKEGVEQHRPDAFPQGVSTKVKRGNGLVGISTRGVVWMDPEEALDFTEQIIDAAGAR